MSTIAAGTSLTTALVQTGDTTGNLVIQTNGTTEAMRIDSSGNVGIGTTSAGSKLDVKGTLRLSGSTSGYVGLAPAAAAGSTTYTLPSADGTNGQLLSTNGSGTLSWSTASGGGSSISAGDSKVEVTDTGSNGTIAFTTDNSERMRIDSSGNVLVGITSARANAGDVQVSKGISFPATQSAQTDANTLDDYEEGTWTPSIGGNATYGGQAGYYVKVGSLVLVQAGINVTTIGTGSTTTVSGLPFTVTNSNGNRTAGSISYYDALNVNVIALYCVAQPNNTQITFASSNASGVGLSNDPAAIFKNSANVQFTMVYRAA
jgi:hypothetical protein